MLYIERVAVQTVHHHAFEQTHAEIVVPSDRVVGSRRFELFVES